MREAIRQANKDGGEKCIEKKENKRVGEDLERGGRRDVTYGSSVKALRLLAKSR